MFVASFVFGFFALTNFDVHSNVRTAERRCMFTNL